MNIQYRWINDDKSIMHFLFHPESTWDDFYTILFVAFEEMHTVNHAIDIIVDVSRLKTIPRETIKELEYLSRLEHINFRHRIMISQNPLMSMIFDCFSRSYPVPSRALHLCPTMELAHDFIATRARENSD